MKKLLEQGPESQLASDVCSVGPSSRMDASDLDAHSLEAGPGPDNPHEHALPFRENQLKVGLAWLRSD